MRVDEAELGNQNQSKTTAHFPNRPHAVCDDFGSFGHPGRMSYKTVFTAMLSTIFCHAHHQSSTEPETLRPAND